MRRKMAAAYSRAERHGESTPPIIKPRPSATFSPREKECKLSSSLAKEFSTRLVENLSITLRISMLIPLKRQAWAAVRRLDSPHGLALPVSAAANGQRLNK